MAEDLWYQTVLLVGDATACSTVLGALSNLAEPNAVHDRAQQSATVHLSNKYYDADVQLQVCEFSRLSETLPALRRAASVEGIALVAPEGCSRARQRLDELSPVHDGAGIRILIVDQSADTGTDKHSDWRDALHAACIRHCTEFCRVCTADAELDAALQYLEDGEGLQRVLEALQAHMWPHMRMRDASRRSGSSSLACGAGADDDCREQGACADAAAARRGAEQSGSTGAHADREELPPEPHAMHRVQPAAANPAAQAVQSRGDSATAAEVKQAEAADALLEEITGALPFQVQPGQHASSPLWSRRATNTSDGFYALNCLQACSEDKIHLGAPLCTLQGGGPAHFAVTKALGPAHDHFVTVGGKSHVVGSCL